MKRVAIVGCGRHMKDTLARYLKRMDGLSFEVCVDLNLDAAREVQAKLNAGSCTNDFEEVDTSKVDVAILALPAAAAFKAASYFIERKVPCFVEKPPGGSTAEMTRLLRAADSLHVYVQVGFNFRFAASVKTIRESVNAGAAKGCVLSIDFKSRYPEVRENGSAADVEDWLRDNGIHAFDLIHWFSGDVKRLSAELFRAEGGKFIVTVLTKHANESTSILRLGNLTQQFDFRITALNPGACQFYMPHLGEVITEIKQGRFAGNILYRTRNLDDGWDRAGYGPELEYLIDHCAQPSCESSSLGSACKASEVCDLTLDTLRRGGYQV